MADPTQAARDVLKKGLSYLVPDNSPLAQSQDDVLTPQARARIDEEKKAEAQSAVSTTQPIQTAHSQPTQFVSQSPAQNTQSQPASYGVSFGKGADMAQEGIVAQGQATAQGEREKAQIYDQYAKDEAARAQDDQRKAAEFQEKSASLMADIENTKKELSNFKFEDPSIWKNKSTGQKILFGIGAFLGSLTPQGAQNISKMINDELDRDLVLQKQEYAKLGDKVQGKQNLYKLYHDKYKDDQIASIAAKNSRLDMVKLHLEKLAANTNSKAVLGKTQEAIGRIEMEQEKSTAAMMSKLQSLQSGGVPGYRGSIKDEVSARDFKKQISNAKAANTEIDNLLNINKKGLKAAFSFDDRASAKQSQALLLGQLREILVGPGSMSEGDRSLMEDAISDPTSFFTLSSSNKIKLDKLKESINRKIEANAAAYGLVKDAPIAREIN